MRLLAWMQKHLSITIPLFMVAGLVFGGLTDAGFLAPLVLPLTLLMVYPMMVTLNVRSVLTGMDVRLQVATQVVNFVLMPLLAYGLGRLFFAGDDPRMGLWAVGLFLVGVLPTSGMTVSWTGFARGNTAAATKMMVLGLSIGAILAPVLTRAFMGAVVEVDMLGMFAKIALVVVLPLVLGYATQRVLVRRHGQERWMSRIKPQFPPISGLGVNLMAFTAVALKARAVLASPEDLLLLALPLLAFYLVSYTALTLLGRALFPRRDAIAMVFGVVMRNLSIALAIAMTAFGEAGADIALLVALAYVVQIQSAALYSKLVDRLFGAAGPAEGPSPTGGPPQPERRSTDEAESRRDAEPRTNKLVRGTP